MAKTTERRDIYAEVTNRIVEMLESGVRPWNRPWQSNGKSMVGGMLPIRWNGDRYNGINVLVLWSEANRKGYRSNCWMTYKQAQSMGANVRKGEKGTTVVYASAFNKTETNDAGDETRRKIPFLKTYTVFNSEQIDGLPEKYTIVEADDEVDHINDAGGLLSAIVEAHRIRVVRAGNSAHYSPMLDSIHMPTLAQFRDAAKTETEAVENYNSTLAHECIHWTGIESRCDRKFGKRFGDDAYAVEELVAEVGSSFLCAILGLSSDVREDHAAYLANWIGILKADKRAIFTAASAASAAVEYLVKPIAGLLPNGNSEDAEDAGE